MRKLISKILIKRGFKKLVKNVQQLNQETHNANQVVDMIFDKPLALIQPWQFRGELIELANEIDTLKPKVSVEIGTANGGTLFMATRLAAEDAKLISIDLPGGKYGGGYPSWKTPIYNSFRKPKQTLTLLRGDSHQVSMFDELKRNLNGEEIDYPFIDGDHSYEGVKKDFEMYTTLVRSGGLVAFHDVVVHPNSSCDVYKYWEEIKTKYDYKEFIDNPEQGFYGIGLITMP
jgi:predicted O-methyltransferase YrrM